MKPKWFQIMVFILFGLAIVQSIHANDPKLGPRDILSITVYDEPSLSLEVVISGDGSFSYPLLERVNAAGRTSSELEIHMQERLRDEEFLVSPTVIVKITEQNSAIVTLAGAIKTPGIVPIYPGIRLREVIARQGGVDDTQAGPFIHLQRLDGVQVQIDREELMQSNNIQSATMNVLLNAGDEIIIPFAENVYILGAVKNPGDIPLTRTLTIGDAIGLAGGRSDNAGHTLLWHHINQEGNQQLSTFTSEQYQSNSEIRNQSMNAGDSIYIPDNDTVFVAGQVNKPGAYPWKPNMTITSAIVEAGDRTFVASRTIRVYRVVPDGSQVMTKYSLSHLQKNEIDNIAKPGDIIHVSHSILNIPYTLRRLNPFSLPLTVLESSVF